MERAHYYNIVILFYQAGLILNHLNFRFTNLAWV